LGEAGIWRMAGILSKGTPVRCGEGKGGEKEKITGLEVAP